MTVGKTKESTEPTNAHLLQSTSSLLIFVIATITSTILLNYLPNNFYASLQKFDISKIQLNCPKEVNISPIDKESILQRPTYAIYGKSKTEDHLRHVVAVLERLGLTRVSVENDWDLLWAHDYPFRVMETKLKNLKPHQKVNHLPGCGYITNKVDLSISNLEFLPSAFKLPENKDGFLKYVEKHPNKLFVVKHNEHRHIAIKPKNEINLNGNNTFVQEFIENPYLVDGYKFDIGIYVIITSIDPLRVYVYKGDVLFRFCPVKYHPFDANNVDKYVVGDDYLPTWEVPSLIYYYKTLGLGMKGSFDAYVQANENADPQLIWDQVENIIRETILCKENNLLQSLRTYKTKNNFFELMRFDLIIDDNLQVHLMEANMSPNLSSAHFKPNSLLYEQILYSAMNMIGIGSPTDRSSLKPQTPDVESMLSSTKNIVVEGEICGKHPCTKSCKNQLCHLCLPCLSKSEEDLLHAAYREHIHRADTKRIFPKPIKNLTTFNIEKEVQNLTSKNQLITRWFYGKCKMDATWCS